MSTSGVYMASRDQIPALPDQPGRQFGGSNTPPDGIPQFEVVAKRRADGTYDHVEYVNIMIPGDPRSIPRHKVTEGIIAKYRPWYDSWKQQQQMAPHGAPLELWPVLTSSQVYELKARNIFTVEQLAGISDANVSNIPMGVTMREQAKAWLKEKEVADDIENRRRESKVMQDGMRLLEQQVQALTAELHKAKADDKAETETDSEPEPEVKQEAVMPAAPDSDLEAKRARMAKARAARAAKKAAVHGDGGIDGGR